jgi:hypothetical protein
MTMVSEPTTGASGRPANVLHALLAAGLAALVLVVADLLVHLLPFRAIARRIDVTLDRNASDTSSVRRVAWAIAAARTRLPWTIPCLASAIAANRLLAWRGIASELWLGVRPSAAMSIDAHAWLIAEGHVVTGGAEKKLYQPLHAIVTRPAPLR